jgi:DNA replication licensing factor MCM3
MIWEEKEEAEEKPPVWNKVQPLMYGKSTKKGAKQDVLHKKFLKKFIHYVKTQPDPLLSDDAREYMASQYASLRSKAQETNRTLPVTARQLETLIRISTAFAKSRLSPVVEESDAMKEGELLQFALYHEVSSEADAAMEAGALESKESQPAAPPAKRQRPSLSAAHSKQSSSSSSTSSIVNSAERESLFTDALMEVFSGTEADEFSDVDLVSAVNSTARVQQTASFSLPEARRLLTAMDKSEDNAIAYIDGNVTRV